MILVVLGRLLQLVGGASLFAGLALARASSSDGATTDWSMVMLLLAIGLCTFLGGRSLGMSSRRPRSRTVEQEHR